MSDSRFYLKVEFEIYGERYGWDCSLNWLATDGEIDERITAWFLDRYTEAYSKYQDAIRDAEEARRKAKIEAHERSELKRLTDKYGAPS